MATYSYKCSDCSNKFDIEATIEEKEMNSKEKFVCPKCKSSKIKQEFSISNFFKSAFNNKKSWECCSEKGSCSTTCESKRKDKKWWCCSWKDNCCG